MRAIHNEDPCNGAYGRVRMRQALLLARPEGIRIPSEGTVRRVMERIGLVHRPKRRSNRITKADREARKSDDLLKRDFHADRPLEKCVADITEIKAKDGKLYVSAAFDCFDLTVLGLVMDTNIKAPLCRSVRTCGELSSTRMGEQRWRALPRQCPLREHVGQSKE